MALHPETVDLSQLPPRDEELVGIGARIHPLDSTPEFGRETMEYAVDIAIKEVRHRLANRQMYAGHGNCLKEGLWREPKTLEP